MSKSVLGRAALVAFGIFLALVCVETGMRLTYWKLKREIQTQTILGTASSPCRILCLGESTTAPMFNEHGKDISWPAHLGPALKRLYPKKSFEIINKGYAATNTSAILATLPDELEQYKPVAVLAMMGVNDSQWYGIVTFDAGFRGCVERVLRHFKTWKLLRYFYHQYASHRSGVENSPSSRKSHGTPLMRPSQPPLSPLDQACAQLASASANNPARALRSCRRAAQASPKDPRPYEALARFYLSLPDHNFKKAAFMARKAFRRGTQDPYMLLILGWMFQNRPQQRNEALVMFKKCVFTAQTHENYAIGIMDICASNLAQTLTLLHRPDNASRAFAWGMSFTPGWLPKNITIAGPTPSDSAAKELPVTTKNYRTLAHILHDHGVPLIAMQYPGWDLQDLKAMLRGLPGIIFVNNKASFQRALSRQNYDSLFVDHFGGTWGHCTAEGNSIISENAAHALKAILQGERCGGERPSPPQLAR
ncbi:MAG TPA: hypothetical protein VNH15_07980 [Elusimicrobiota bacterium]|nr:hypothetical protein [Elusimicrobiota bacterium]